MRLVATRWFVTLGAMFPSNRGCKKRIEKRLDEGSSRKNARQNVNLINEKRVVKEEKVFKRVKMDS